MTNEFNSKYTGGVIGYEVQEDCRLNGKNFEAGEKIMIADHCNQ